MEWKKILVNRKLLALMIVLFLMQTITFWQDCEKTDRKWIERYGQTYDTYLKEQELQHIDTYRAKVQAIMEQADAMNGISIFAQKDSFSNRNLALTKKAFEPLLNVELTYVKGRTVTEFFSFRFGGLCALLCGLAIAFELSEIRKKRVRSITFTTEYGKLRLALEKAGALLIWAFGVTFLFQTGILLEGVLLFREDPLRILFSPAQTFACFEAFPLKAAVWQVMILYLLYRTAILYVIMVLAWSVAMIFDHMVLAVGIGGVFFAAEYFLYANIDDNHVWKLLKYCNIWYQAAENSYFTKYKNLNILEYAVNRNTVMIIAMTIAYLSGAGVAIWISCTRYPCSSKVSRLHRMISAVKEKVEEIRGMCLEKLSLSGMEGYKVLVTQKGLLAMLLLGVLLYYKADFTQIQRSTQQEMYYEFMEHYLGEPDEDSAREIAQLVDRLEQIDVTFSRQLMDESLDAETKFVLSLWYDSFSEDRLFLKQIQEQTESLETISRESGIAVWYVNLYGYDHLLRNDDVMLNTGLLLVMLWICVGMYIGENGSGMACMLNSSYREKFLYRTKRRVAMTFTSLIYFVVLLYEIISVAVVYGISGVGAPVQSVLALSGVRFHCTIWQYFFVRYAVKCVLFLAICLIGCRVSETIICKKGLANGIKSRKSV